MSKEIIYWTMKNGQKINIDEMTIDHLRNTLKIIIRQSQQYIHSPNNIEEAFEDCRDANLRELSSDAGFDPHWDLD